MRASLILLALLWTFPSLAQESPENWAMARLLCQTDSSYRVEIEALGAVDTVIIGLDNQDAIEWQVDSESLKQFDVSLGNTNLSLVAYAWGGAFYADGLALRETNPCAGQEMTENTNYALMLSLEHLVRTIRRD